MPTPGLLSKCIVPPRARHVARMAPSPTPRPEYSVADSFVEKPSTQERAAELLGAAVGETALAPCLGHHGPNRYRPHRPRSR